METCISHDTVNKAGQKKVSVLYVYNCGTSLSISRDVEQRVPRANATPSNEGNVKAM